MSIFEFETICFAAIKEVWCSFSVVFTTAVFLSLCVGAAIETIAEIRLRKQEQTAQKQPICAVTMEPCDCSAEDRHKPCNGCPIAEKAIKEMPEFRI